MDPIIWFLQTADNIKHLNFSCEIVFKYFIPREQASTFPINRVVDNSTIIILPPYQHPLLWEFRRLLQR